MKRIKNLIVFLAGLVIPVFVSAQVRTSSEVISYIDQSESFTSATGWYYDSKYEEWIDNPNAICEKEYKSSWDEWVAQSRGIQNFKNFKFCSVEYNGKKYYILRIEYYEGYYRYPNIRDGWTSRTLTGLFLYSENDYNKLKSLETMANGSSITLNTLYYCAAILYPDEKEKELLVDIQNFIKQGAKSSVAYKPFKIYKSTEGDIRFYLPNSKTNANFNKYYFETTVPELSKIIIK